MKVRDSELKDLFQEATKRTRVEGCLRPDELRTAEGLWPFWRRRRIAGHLATCSDCAQEHLLASAVDAWAADQAGLTRTAWIFPTWVVVLAPLLVVASLTPLAILKWHSVAPPVLRGTDRQIVSLLDEERPQGRAHLVLRWSGAPEGSRYSVTVMTEDLTVVFRGLDLSRPELEVPAASLASVPRGGRLQWIVEAATPDGARLSSRAFASRLD